MKGGCINMNCETGYCGGGSRNFLTKKERIGMLQEYKQDLDNESKGVAERIAELESDS